MSHLKQEFEIKQTDEKFKLLLLRRQSDGRWEYTPLDEFEDRVTALAVVEDILKTFTGLPENDFDLDEEHAD